MFVLVCTEWYKLCKFSFLILHVQLTTHLCIFIWIVVTVVVVITQVSALNAHRSIVTQELISRAGGGLRANRAVFKLDIVDGHVCCVACSHQSHKHHSKVSPGSNFNGGLVPCVTLVTRLLPRRDVTILFSFYHHLQCAHCLAIHVVPECQFAVSTADVILHGLQDGSVAQMTSSATALYVNIMAWKKANSLILKTEGMHECLID